MAHDHGHGAADAHDHAEHAAPDVRRRAELERSRRCAAELEALPGVDCVHDLHVWASGTIGHVTLQASTEPLMPACGDPMAPSHGRADLALGASHH